MSDHIPLDTLTNIFRRLAVNDLVRCRRVTKHWLSTIDDPQFISSHLQHSISKNSNLAFLQGSISPLLYWKDVESVDHHPTENPIPFQFQPAGKVRLMGSCHGLICFSKDELPRDFMVMNPSTGERHTFGSRETVELEEELPHLLAYGVGFDESTADYKVVRITTKVQDYATYSTEIYSVRSKRFSRKHPSPVHVWAGSNQRIGAFASGALHWCVSVINTADQVILAFDLRSETYSQLQLPNYDADDIGWDLVSIGFVDSCLCTCAMNEDAEQIDIWVMKEYNKVGSWSKIYSIGESLLGDAMFSVSLVPVGSKGCRVLLLSEWRRVEAIEMNLDDDGCSYEAVSCVESLVKIFPPQKENLM